MNIEITPKQKQFIQAAADEVLFGGAAGGGKSYGQIIDAFLYALKYPKSKQLILRRTFPELDKSLIRTALLVYPSKIFKYSQSSHTGKFVNGSLIDFGYCDNETDVIKYQSAEYDVIRFDELTHFTEDMYIYLISRLRGANDYPKSIKSSTNPGGIGHAWVKSRFIDIGAPDVLHDAPTGSKIFIPSKVTDNHFLLSKDPDYIRRLENLSENDKRALLYGDWDIFEGQYFTEFNRDIHVVTPFTIPNWWRRYFAMDYGLDMFAGYWIAVDDRQNEYVYREVYKPDLIISDMLSEIKQFPDKIYEFIAPPDMWNRRQDTGQSVADIAAENGIYFKRASNDRVMGFLNVKEHLKIFTDEQSKETSQLKIFANCLNLIRCFPLVQHDKKNPSDVSREPHEVTHAIDAIRYFVAGRPSKAVKPKPERVFNFEVERPKNALGAGGKINVI